MTVIEYRRRASIAEKGETLWRAHPDRLEQVAPDGTLVMTVPYQNIRQVRLAFAPSRYQQARFLIEMKGARSRLTISNMHFAGIGQFEDRTDTFFPLVRSVVHGVGAASPAAEFRAGERPALYWMLIALNVAVFTVLTLVILFLPIAPGNVGLSALIKAAVIAFSLPLMLSWAINSRPRAFSPDRDLEKVFATKSG